MKKMIMILLIIFCSHHTRMMTMERNNNPSDILQHLSKDEAIPQFNSNSYEEHELIEEILEGIDTHQKWQKIQEAYESHKRKRLDSTSITTVRDLVSRAERGPYSKLQSYELQSFAGTCCDYFSQEKNEEIIESARRNLNPFGPLSGNNLDTMNILLKLFSCDVPNIANNN